MAKLYDVKLTEAQREMLLAMTTQGEGGAMSQRRARTLLLADAGRGDAAIAQALQIGRATVERTRRRFVEEGLPAALQRRVQRRPSKRPKLDGEKEAHLVAVVCSTPPQGHGRWSLRLLADRLVELSLVESISQETVRRTLKKKQAQALAQAQAVVHPTRGKRRLCRPHGRRAGSLHAAL